MAFDEEVPQVRLGPFQWILIAVLLSFLGAVIWTQVAVIKSRARRHSCLERQDRILNCVAVWEARNQKFPEGTRGYACFTQVSGTIFKTEGLPPEFSDKAIADCSGIAPWICPEELHQKYHGDISKAPDDGSPEGYGNYAFAQDDKMNKNPPLADLVGSYPPLRVSFCAAWGGKNKLGPDGRKGSRHSDRW